MKGWVGVFTLVKLKTLLFFSVHCVHLVRGTFQKMRGFEFQRNNHGLI